jgi:hypothetical protein
MASGNGQPRTYDITTETKRGVVALSALTEEIGSDVGITTDLDFINAESGTCSVYFVSELSAGEITALDVVLAAHEGYSSVGTVRRGGGLIVEDLSDPEVPTVSAQGTTGSTTWGYKVTAFSDTGETLASGETQITDGNAALSTTNFNEVSWSAVDGATSYGVYRTTAGGTPSSTGFVAQVAGLTYADIGNAASGSEPSEDLSGALVVGTGTVSSSKAATIKELTSDTSTVTSLLRLARRSSGEVDAGFGTGLYFQLDDDGGTLRDVGSLHFRWDDPSSGTLHSKARIQLRDGGSSADKDIEFHHDGKIIVLGDTILEKTTCKATYGAGYLAVSGGSWYSNNDRLCIRLENGFTQGFRTALPVPQNYASGDLTFRILYTVSATQASNRAVAYDFYWRGDAIGTTFETMHNEQDNYDVSSQIGDQPYGFDLTLAAANFSKDDDWLSFFFDRLGDDAGDTCTTSFFVHGVQLRYTGWSFAGQSGQ